MLKQTLMAYGTFLKFTQSGRKWDVCLIAIIKKFLTSALLGQDFVVLFSVLVERETTITA